MSRTWTTKERAGALEALCDPRRSKGWDLDLGYDVVPRWSKLSIVESAVHEIAHAVCLRLDRKDRVEWEATLPNVSGAVAEALGRFTDSRRLWQEILTLAAEELVLRRLNLRVWHIVAWRAARRSAKGREQWFMGCVRRAARWKITRRRADRVMCILDDICERGERAQAL